MLTRSKTKQQEEQQGAAASSNQVQCGCMDSTLIDPDKLVSCDLCKFWHDFKCVGITKELETSRWLCRDCVVRTPKMKNIQRKKLVSEPGRTGSQHQVLSRSSVSYRDVATEILQTRDQHFKPPQTQQDGTQSHKSTIKSMLSTSEIRRQLEMEQIEEEKQLADRLNDERMRATNDMWESRMKEQEAIFKDRQVANMKYLEQKFKLLQSSAGSDISESAHSGSILSCEEKEVNTKRWVSEVSNHSVLSLDTCGASGINLAESRKRIPAPIQNHIQRSYLVHKDLDHLPKCAVPRPSFNPEPEHIKHNNKSTPKNVQEMDAPRNSSQNQFIARQVIKTDLPIFSGKPEEWAHFISAYDCSSDSCGLSNAENLSRLQKCLKGRAFEAVRYLLLSPNTVSEAIETLRALYGRPEIIIHTLMSDIMKHPAPKSDKFETVVDFALSVRNLTTMMKVTNLNDYLNNNIVLQELVQKLPTQIRMNWAQETGNHQRVNLLTFSDWLFKFAMSLNNVIMPHLDLCKSKTSKNHTVNTHQENETIRNGSDSKIISEIKSTKQPCVVCLKDTHKVEECNDFKSLNMDDRWAKLIELKLCRKCLGNHYYLQCRSRKMCGINGCEARHHPLFHRDIVPQETQTVNTHHASKKIFFRILPIKLYGRGDVVINTFAFLDDGSSLTLIEEDLAEELNLDGDEEDLCLRWTKNTTRVEKNSKRVAMEISGQDEGACKYAISNVRTVENLSLPVQSISIDDIQRYRHTHTLPISTYTQAVPRILIGIDNSKLVCPLKSKDGDWDEPVATKTRLGWTLHGLNNTDGSDNKEEHVHMNLHISDCTRDDEIYQVVKDQFDIESLSIQKPACFPESIKSKREQEIMQRMTRNISSDRYETGLCVTAEMLHPSDQQAHRFLWKEDPDHYVLQVMSFGATCSPSLAQYALNSNAREFQQTHPRAVESVIRNHNVDDMFDSADTDDEAVQLIQDVTMIQLLPRIENINVQRCYSRQTPNHEITSRELHVFVDASEDAYAAVAYFRIETIHNQVICTLIRINVRVVPQQPRAELQAATTNINEHRIGFQRRIMWSDSRTVLCWLNADCRKFKPFVAFRVGEILENTDIKEWRWVPTRANVADDAAKWQHQVPNFDESCRWFKAPDFLYQAEEHWPQSKEQNHETVEDLRPKHVLVCTESINQGLGARKFSSWTRMLRTCAYMLLFVRKIRRKQRRANTQHGPLTKEELISAEKYVFRQAQSDAYAEEVAALSHIPPKPICKPSQLSNRRHIKTRIVY